MKMRFVGKVPTTYSNIPMEYRVYTDGEFAYLKRCLPDEVTKDEDPARWPSPLKKALDDAACMQVAHRWAAIDQAQHERMQRLGFW